MQNNIKQRIFYSGITLIAAASLAIGITSSMKAQDANNELQTVQSQHLKQQESTAKVIEDLQARVAANDNRVTQAAKDANDAKNKSDEVATVNDKQSTEITELKK